MFCMQLYANPSLPVSLAFSFSHRLKISESTKIDTILGNSTIFEYLENKVRIKLYSLIHRNSFFRY